MTNFYFSDFKNGSEKCFEVASKKIEEVENGFWKSEFRFERVFRNSITWKYSAFLRWDVFLGDTFCKWFSRCGFFFWTVAPKHIYFLFWNAHPDFEKHAVFLFTIFDSVFETIRLITEKVFQNGFKLVRKNRSCRKVMRNRDAGFCLVVAFLNLVLSPFFWSLENRREDRKQICDFIRCLPVSWQPCRRVGFHFWADFYESYFLLWITALTNLARHPILSPWV